MFNLWKRTYVQLFTQRDVFDTKVIIGDRTWATVVFPESSFSTDGSLALQESSLEAILTKHYNGQISELFASLRADSNSKYSIVLDYSDYHKLLAYYLMELQHTFKFSNEDLHMMAYSYLYTNFYHSGDQNFADGFVGQTQQEIIKTIFKTYTATGVLDLIDPVDLPSEIAYFLIKRGIVTETDLEEKFINLAKLVVRRLWSIHYNDFSEWLVMDTTHFLNMLRAPGSPEVVAGSYAFADMLNFMKMDPYLNTMFFTANSFFNGQLDWDKDPNFNLTASRLVSAFRGLAEYLVQRGIDAEWAEIRHSEYAEIILRYEYVMSYCKAVQYILKLDGAPESLDKPLIETLDYALLSECMDTKYNKTLLLITLRGMSPIFQSFITSAFSE